MKLKQLITLFVLHLIIIWPATTAYALSMSNKVTTPGQNSVTLDIVTDEDTTAEIKYGPTTSLGSTKKDETSKKLHSITLSSLSPATKYYYRIIIKNSQGGSKTYPSGTNYVVNTLDSTPPHKLSGLQDTSVSRTSVSLSWDASLDADTDHYNIYRDGAKIGQSDSDSYTDTGLAGSTTYSYKVSSVDNGDNEGPLSDALSVTTSAADTAAPTISELRPASVTKTTAIISWDTDEDTDAKLNYGTSQSSLSLSKSKSAFELVHSISIDSLTDGTTYYYQAVSCDESGNCDTSSVESFAAGSDVTAPTIDVTVPEFYNDLEMDISGSTEPLSNIYLYVNNRVSAFKATDTTGRFNLRAIGLSTSQANDLRFESEDQSGNKVTKSFTVIIDLAKPQVNVNIPDVTAQKPLFINGTVNEDVTIKTIIDSGLEKNISVSAGNFRFELDLNEGTNSVSIEFIDNAGNVYEIEKDIILDTTPPVILEPTDLTYYSPSYSPGLKILGKVDTPGATVLVTVNDKSSAASTPPTSLSGIIEYFKQHGDAYTAVADANGDFEVDVMLSRIGYEPGANLSRTGLRSGEVGGRARVGGAGYEGFTDKDFTINRIKIIAIDTSGMQSKPLEGNIKYEICGRGGAWQVNIKDVSPGSVQSEHLMRGIGQFGFNMELKYQGSGTDAAVLGKPRMTVYDVSKAEKEQRKHGQLITRPASEWTDDNENGHFLFRLRKWPGTLEELEDVDFLKFPMMLEFQYTHEVFGKRQPSATQKQCIDVTVQLEKPISEKNIPEHFLQESVKWIEKGVENLETATSYLTQLQTYLTWSCLGSWAALFLKDMLIKVQCVQVDKEMVKGTLAEMVDWPGTPEKTCKDAGDAESACNNCAKAKDNSRKLKAASNILCDRVFCPAVPTIEQHGATYKDPDLAGVGGIDSACENEKGEGCKAEYEREWDTACVFMDEWYEANKEVDTSPGVLDRLLGSANICKSEKDDTARWMRTTVNGSSTVFVTEGGNLYEAKSISGTGEIKGSDQPFTAKNVEQHQKKKYAKPLIIKYNEKGKPDDLFLYEDTDGDGKWSEGDTKTGLKHNEDIRRVSEKPRKYIVNPTEGILNSLRCLCIPALNGYLTLWKNILNAVKKCFQSILITKKADSGICKATLTIYVCDLVYDAIRCVFATEGATAGGTRSGAVAGFSLGTLTNAISGASNNIQNSAESRYGKSSIFQSMFSERKLVHAVCAAAFTGDWDIDMSTMLQGDFAIPLDSEVFLWPATRRYITYDPTHDGLTSWIYHMGIGIVAGSKIDWTLDLICSNTNTCPDSGNLNSACDCALGRNPESKIYTAASGHLEAGQTFGDSEEGDNYFEVTEPYRFDRAVLTYTYVDNAGEVQKKEVTRKIRAVGSAPPAECQFDALDFMFRCSFVLGEGGRAGFTLEPKLKDKPKSGLYNPGEKIKVNLELFKRSPGYNEADEGSVDEQIPKYLGYRLLNQDKVAIPLTEKGSGSWEYLPLIRDGVYSDEKGGDFEIDIIPEGYVIKEDDFERRKSAAKGRFEIYDVKETKDTALRASLRVSQPVTSPDKGLNFTISFESKEQDGKTKCKIEKVKSFTQEGRENATNIKTKGSEIEFNCGKGVVYTYEGITFKFPADPAPGSAVLLQYLSPGEAAKANDRCQRYTQSNLAEWTLEVALYNAEAIDKDEPLSATNAKRSKTVTSYKGKKQLFKVPVKVWCTDTGEETEEKEFQWPSFTVLDANDKTISLTNGKYEVEAETRHRVILYADEQTCNNIKIGDGALEWDIIPIVAASVCSVKVTPRVTDFTMDFKLLPEEKEVKTLSFVVKGAPLISFGTPKLSFKGKETNLAEQKGQAKSVYSFPYVLFVEPSDEVTDVSFKLYDFNDKFVKEYVMGEELDTFIYYGVDLTNGLSKLQFKMKTTNGQVSEKDFWINTVAGIHSAMFDSFPSSRNLPDIELSIDKQSAIHTSPYTFRVGVEEEDRTLSKNVVCLGKYDDGETFEWKLDEKPDFYRGYLHYFSIDKTFGGTGQRSVVLTCTYSEDDEIKGIRVYPFAITSDLQEAKTG